MTMLIPGVSRSLLNAPAEAIINMIKKGGTFLPIPFANWTATNVGSGGGAIADTIIPTLTGATANSSGLKTIRLYGFATNAIDGTTLNWGKKIIVHLGLQRDISDAEATARIQVKTASTIGVLGAKGFGLQIDNLALTAESYGTSLATIDLATTLTLEKTYRLTIIHDPSVPKIEWYIDKVLKGTQTTAEKMPTGSGIAYVAVSTANGVTGGSNYQLMVYQGWIWQAF